MPNAARQARTAWSSNATGAPNTAMIPSPVNLSTVPPYRCTTAAAAVDQLGHDLAQPLRTDRRRDVHRMHHIGEQHRHLLVLRRSGGLCDRRTALVAELGVRVAVRCRTTHRTAPSRSVHRHHPRWGPRQYRFTAGQRCPSYRRAISDTGRRWSGALVDTVLKDSPWNASTGTRRSSTRRCREWRRQTAASADGQVKWGTSSVGTFVI